MISIMSYGVACFFSALVDLSVSGDVIRGCIYDYCGFGGFILAICSNSQLRGSDLFHALVFFLIFERVILSKQRVHKKQFVSGRLL